VIMKPMQEDVGDAVRIAVMDGMEPAMWYTAEDAVTDGVLDPVGRSAGLDGSRPDALGMSTNMDPVLTAVRSAILRRRA